MGHGTPDWGITAAKSTIYSLHDMGELAVRLGSIVSFDRRGDVIFLDDFSQGSAKVSVTGSGVGNEIYPSCANPLSGSLHLILKTGPTAEDRSGFSKVIPYPVAGGLGIECSFVPLEHLLWFELRLYSFDGEFVRLYRMRYNHQTGTIALLDFDGEWKVVGTPGAQREGYTFYSTLKMVVDTLNKKYVRFILNDHTYLPGALHLPDYQEDDTTKSVSVHVTAYTNIDDNIAISIDNFIVTQNEPVS